MLVEKVFNGLLKHLTSNDQEVLTTIVSILFNTLFRTTDDIVKKFLEQIYEEEICMIEKINLKTNWRASDEDEKPICKMYFKCSKGIRCAVFSNRFIWIKWRDGRITPLGLLEGKDSRHHEAWQMYLAKLFGEEYIKCFEAEREKEYEALKKVLTKNIENTYKTFNG